MIASKATAERWYLHFPFLTDYFADVQTFIFREQFILLFIFLYVNLTPPRPDQTNVESHIFVFMYVDKIVKWTVTNNVNMFFSE